MPKSNRNSSSSDASSADSMSSGLQRLRSKKQSSRVTWSDVSADLIAQVLDVCSSSGALISFSRTSDGGALHVYVKEDRDSENWYAADAEKLREILEELFAAYK